MGQERTYNFIFRVLYAGLLIGVLFCVSMIVIDPQKSIQLYPYPGTAVHLFSDIGDGQGNSTVAWLNRDETFFECNIGYGAPYPYCGMVIKYKRSESKNPEERDLFEFNDAMAFDLSAYDGIKIFWDYSGDSNALSFVTRSAPTLPKNQSEYDLVPFSYTNFDSRKKQEFIELSRMEVAKWWIDRYNPPRKLRTPSFDSIFELSISVPELPVAGIHKIRLNAITATKSYFTQQSLLAATYVLLAIGFLALIVQVVLEYFARRYTRENHALRSTINMDPLTKCLNRLGLEAAIENVFPLAKQLSIYVMVLDLDHFKEINDTHGHTAGDEVLRKVSQAVSRELRSDDVLGRWGGEEFVIISKISPDHLEGLVNRLLHSLREVTVEGLEHGVISMSIGVTKAKVGEAFDDVFKRADEAMYQVKQAGRGSWKII